jgi:hypothetical protein
VSLLPLGLVALLLAEAAPPKGDPVRPPAPPGLSWEDADSVARTVARVERRLRSGRPASPETIVVTERQINSYVNLALAAKILSALSGLEVDLQKDRLLAWGMLDLDQVKSKIPQGAGLLGLPERPGARGAGGASSATRQRPRRGGEAPWPIASPGRARPVVSQSTRNPKRPGVRHPRPVPLPFTARRSVRARTALVDFFQ